MMRGIFFCGCIAMASSAWASITDTVKINSNDLYQSAQEIDRMDSLIESWFSTNPAILFAEADYQAAILATDTPTFSPEVYTERIQKINTPIPLIYNSTVQSFIDLYVLRRRSKVAEMLTLGQEYFPMIEAELDRRGLPMELKYVAVIESALNTHAVSKAGATGMWQMMYGTGKLMGLQIDSYVDERRDPYLATEAGIEYLSRMFDVYGDWLLAIAAYNCGPGNVNKALRKSGGGTKTFWEIWKYLPAETRSYVPIFIAATYTFEYHQEHNIVPSSFHYAYNLVDTVLISKKMTLDQLSPFVGLSIDELKLYNPALKTNTIPGGNVPFPIRMPMDAVALWISNQDKLYAEIEQPAVVLAKTSNQTTTEAKTDTKATTSASTVTVYYTVKKNDNLGYISEWFDCSVTELKRWNGMSSTKIVPGQKLKVKVPADLKDEYAAINSMSFSQKQKLTDIQMVEKGEQKKESEIVYYTVKAGDSLWSISKKYPENSIETLQEMNKLGSSETLKVGAKIKIVK